MTGTTAKAHLVDLLLDPLRGCTGLYTYRQEIIQKVMSMPALEAKERLNHLLQVNYPESEEQ
jgi:CMP-2-keto-3-deoxyoctulosonic acid synthetase